MQTTTILSMLIFSLSMSISPGPVNITILSSSLNYGLNKTIPFISGATLGFTFLLIFIGFGFAQIINAHPLLFRILEILGSLFIIYIGYKILSSKPEIKVSTQTNLDSPPNFIDGWLLQWINPKAWIACTSSVALFSHPENTFPIYIFIIIYFFICYSALMIWGFLGQRLSLLLRSHKRIYYFNFIMGISLIVISLYMMVK
ncbi:LysE family translocator [Acinetobacter sp.]|uniref:LysE family translocator n=1 Tax=Acinetobacter sp. TaxID=472 RepID=UPI0031D72F3E